MGSPSLDIYDQCHILLDQQASGNDIADIFFLIFTFMFCRPQHASLVYDMVHEFYIGDLEPGAVTN